TDHRTEAHPGESTEYPERPTDDHADRPNLEPHLVAILAHLERPFPKGPFLEPAPIERCAARLPAERANLERIQRQPGVLLDFNLQFTGRQGHAAAEVGQQAVDLRFELADQLQRVANQLRIV